jgi:hypothetical protein
MEHRSADVEHDRVPEPVNKRPVDPASSQEEGTDDATLPSGEAISQEIRELMDYNRAERDRRHTGKKGEEP